jgi:hypothetical protein
MGGCGHDQGTVVNCIAVMRKLTLEYCFREKRVSIVLCFTGCSWWKKSRGRLVTKMAGEKKTMSEIQKAICRCTMKSSDEEVMDRLGKKDG